jgi:hypothetical protein
MKRSDLLDVAKIACGVAAVVAIAALSLWRAGALHFP